MGSLKPHFALLYIVALALVISGCDMPSKQMVAAEPTPDIEATVEAIVSDGISEDANSTQLASIPKVAAGEPNMQLTDSRQSDSKPITVSSTNPPENLPTDEELREERDARLLRAALSELMRHYDRDSVNPRAKPQNPARVFWWDNYDEPLKKLSTRYYYCWNTLGEITLQTANKAVECPEEPLVPKPPAKEQSPAVHDLGPVRFNPNLTFQFRGGEDFGERCEYLVPHGPVTVWAGNTYKVRIEGQTLANQFDVIRPGEQELTNIVEPRNFTLIGFDGTEVMSVDLLLGETRTEVITFPSMPYLYEIYDRFNPQVGKIGEIISVPDGMKSPGSITGWCTAKEGQMDNRMNATIFMLRKMVDPDNWRYDTISEGYPGRLIIDPDEYMKVYQSGGERPPNLQARLLMIELGRIEAPPKLVLTADDP